MKWAFVPVSALVLAGAIVSASADAAAIKPGLWEFTTQLQPARAPVAQARSSGGAQQQAGGVGATYTSCIESDRAVPAAFGPQCRLDGAEHSGTRFSWSMTCTNSNGAVRSDGVAEYRGDAMAGTMVSQLPGPNGKVTHITQHIVGHYLGRCSQRAETATAAGAPTQPRPAGHDGGSAATQPGMPAAAPSPKAENAAPAAAAAETASDAESAETAEPPGRGGIGHRHHAHHRHHSRHRYAGRQHHRHRHYAYRYGGGVYSSYAASSGFGPAPRGGNGP